MSSSKRTNHTIRHQMKPTCNVILLFIPILLWLAACAPQSSQPFEADNIFAWCIVPFDSEERSPQERLDMLADLGIKRYAYDWRQKHLDEMASEIELAQEQGIDIMAVWMWIDANSDSVGHLSAANERVLSILEKTGLQTTIWLSFHENYFADLAPAEALAKGVDMVKYIASRAQPMGGKVGLYNHGAWFGEPENQVAILKAIPEYSIGLIYNFHHAHEQLSAYPQLVKTMKPYLWAVNLNGMKAEGPKILPIGKGDREQEMIQLLKDEGFAGPWGVLGHVETADVRLILEENLAGLRSLEID